MADRPSAYPDWATTLNIDPVSGQQNYLEPPSPKKVTGFDRFEVPPRQWVNWLLRENGRWVRYFDEGQIYTDTNVANTNLPYTPSQYELILRKPSANVVYGLLKITATFTGTAGGFSVWKISNIPVAFRPTSDVQTSIYMEESAELRPHVVTATDDGDLEFKKPTANYSDPGGLVTYDYSSFMYVLKT